MRTIVDLICPDHRKPLQKDSMGEALLCPQGCRYSIRGGIPRFVLPGNYAAGFGLQWNAFRKTQLDSHTGTSLSHDRLRRIAGGDLDIFRDRTVLEAGCGAGRFTEIMLERGARVFATDLSLAVESNYASCARRPNYFVCQADLVRLPVRPEVFDVVVCVGVVQHTPDPEETIRALCGYVKPGGTLMLDHYSPGYPVTPSRRALRRLLLGRSPRFALAFCRMLVGALWPLHRVSNRLKARRGGWRLREFVLRHSPVVDYQDAYPQLGANGLHEWAILDTHDTLTDHYKHLRTAEQIRAVLARCGMQSIQTEYAGNGVEARATKAPSQANP